MKAEEFELILKDGETITVEFKSWIHTKNMKERIALAVDELVAFANTKGGTIYFGVEDKTHEVTGCDSKHDLQGIMESIYDKTRPPLFTDVNDFYYKEKRIISMSVESDGVTYATTDGRCLKRLGKNSKPFYPDEMGNKYTAIQNPDFSGQVVDESTIDDINILEIYNLKEKLRLRDTKSTLSEMEDIPFLRDLGLLKEDGNIEKLTIAGLLFVGKEKSIMRLLPQAEVVYLHYSPENLEEYDARIDLKQPIITIIDKLTEKIQASNKIVNIQMGLFRLEVAEFPEKVFQEALLNAITHRDYQHTGAIYVKHYPEKIVIENPGCFLDGITEKNIITHPSVPRNKLIAETLQRLKYVQRTGQGVDIIFKEMVSMGKPYPQYRSFDDAISLTVFSSIDDMDFVKFIVQEQEKRQYIMSLAEVMVLRYLTDNKKIVLSEVSDITQMQLDDARRCCNSLIKLGLVEIVGKEYMFTAKAYEAIKSGVEYTRDRTVQYIKAKNMILEYLQTNDSITNATVQELCNFTKQQSRTVIDKMRKENLLIISGGGKTAKYILK